MTLINSYVMIRTVVTPNNNMLSFNVPDRYVGKKVEVIAFVAKEPFENIIYSNKDKKSFSAIKLSTKGYEFNREEANER